MNVNVLELILLLAAGMESAVVVRAHVRHPEYRRPSGMNTGQ